MGLDVTVIIDRRLGIRARRRQRDASSPLPPSRRRGRRCAHSASSSTQRSRQFPHSCSRRRLTMPPSGVWRKLPSPSRQAAFWWRSERKTASCSASIATAWLGALVKIAGQIARPSTAARSVFAVRGADGPIVRTHYPELADFDHQRTDRRWDLTAFWRRSRSQLRSDGIPILQRGSRRS